jgi:predicted DNA-binding protein (UPF0251 family)
LSKYTIYLIVKKVVYGLFVYAIVFGLKHLVLALFPFIFSEGGILWEAVLVLVLVCTELLMLYNPDLIILGVGINKDVITQALSMNAVGDPSGNGTGSSSGNSSSESKTIGLTTTELAEKVRLAELDFDIKDEIHSAASARKKAADAAFHGHPSINSSSDHQTRSLDRIRKEVDDANIAYQNARTEFEVSEKALGEALDNAKEGGK